MILAHQEVKWETWSCSQSRAWPTLTTAWIHRNLEPCVDQSAEATEERYTKRIRRRDDTAQAQGPTSLPKEQKNKKKNKPPFLWIRASSPFRQKKRPPPLTPSPKPSQPTNSHLLCITPPLLMKWNPPRKCIRHREENLKKKRKEILFFFTVDG